MDTIVLVILAEFVIVGAILSALLFFVLLNVGILPEPGESEWLSRFVIRRRAAFNTPTLFVSWRGTDFAVSAVSSGLLILGLIGQPVTLVEREGVRAGAVYSGFDLDYDLVPPDLYRTKPPTFPTSGSLNFLIGSGAETAAPSRSILVAA